VSDQGVVPMTFRGTGSIVDYYLTVRDVNQAWCSAYVHSGRWVAQVMLEHFGPCGFAEPITSVQYMTVVGLKQNQYLGDVLRVIGVMY
jgi:hypothetical protein